MVQMHHILSWQLRNGCVNNPVTVRRNQTALICEHLFSGIVSCIKCMRSEHISLDFQSIGMSELVVATEVAVMQLIYEVSDKEKMHYTLPGTVYQTTVQLHIGLWLISFTS